MNAIDTACHVVYALRNAPTQPWPFPHFYAKNVFPDAFYGHLLQVLGEKTDYSSVPGHYEGRTFSSPDGIAGLEFMNSREFLQHMCALFPSAMQARFAGKKAVVYHDLRLVRDAATYAIGPHTDAPWKLVSLLFYLPTFSGHARHGTSIYLPRERATRCAGGPHYNFADFDRLHTAPYLPNTCFGFFKTDASFHGVEPIGEPIRRDVLLYNIYDSELYSQSHAAPAAPAEPPTPPEPSP